MNYSEQNQKPKSLSTGFYIVLGCCILILGGAAWFALSGLNNDEIKQEYPKNDSSYYIESLPEISIPEAPIEQTAESEEQVPYEESAPAQETEPKASYTMPVEGEIVKDYSETTLVFSKTYGDMRLHTGIDIACKVGTSVSAAADGTVNSVEKDSALGNVVIIDHGTVTVKYASLEEIKVKNGQKVKMGDIIGITGTVVCECEDKPHLHIEAYKDGKTISPLKAIGLEK